MKFMRLVCVAVLLSVASALPAGAADFERGLPRSPEFFPIAVWLQNPSNAAKYKALGINVYVGLYRGPTEQQLAALEKAGMLVICHQSEFALANKDRRVIAAWMHGDEPDNAQPLPRGQQGWGPPIAPEKIVADYQRLKQNDPSRPVLLNLGQGVAWDNWHGRGVRSRHPEDYPEYLKGCDIASFDIYPAVHDKPEIAGKLWYVPFGVDRLRKWTDGKKPAWCCIECTHIGNEKVMPTVEQVRAEVWMALIHGANGLIYFCHEFKPRFIEAGMLAYPEMAKGIGAINQQIHALAPALNSPTLADAATASSSSPQTPIDIMVKRHGGATYVFAVAMRDGATRGSFSVAGLKGSNKITVLGENRTLTAADGKWDDAFKGYEVHLYRVE